MNKIIKEQQKSIINSMGNIFNKTRALNVYIAVILKKTNINKPRVISELSEIKRKISELEFLLQNIE